ncbi:MAG TPA: hypothetical protein VFN75_02390, partial [Pseudonocardiaceae bacterium]|nr:hypothetical protein [Pseudonocardiaceae bacterium]
MVDARWGVSARCELNADSLEDQPHGAGRKPVTKPSEFTVDASVSPGGVLRDQTQDQPAQLGCRAATAGSETFEQIGRIHYQQRREINRLLAAYRTGAAVAWRHVSDTALRLGVPPEMLARLAAVIFAAVDQLSSASLRCYAQA